MNKKRKLLDEQEIMSRNHSKVVRSWSSTVYLVEELDQIAKEIKAASNVHCDRSKLLNALVEVLITNRHNLDKNRIVDHRTLVDELTSMLKKR